MKAILALFILFFVTFGAQTKGGYISNARVAQIVKQEKERCHRCTEKELLIRINKRLAQE